MKTQQEGERRLAQGLGWFSIGLGLAELAAPRTIAQLVGVPDDSTTRQVLRAYGAREIATGIGILSSRPQPAWLWTRVAGDVLDLATLAAAMRRDGVESSKIASAAASVAGVMVADIAAARQLHRASSDQADHEDRARLVSKTFTVNRAPDEVAQRWLELQMLPQIDTVRFDPAPGGRGTEVRVQFHPKWVGALRAGKVQEQLRQFKQLVETGEVTRSADEAHLLQPAQPRFDASLAGAGGAR